MRYDGNFQVGIHGSGALMQDIPEVIENWMKTLPENYINHEVKIGSGLYQFYAAGKIKSNSQYVV